MISAFSSGKLTLGPRESSIKRLRRRKAKSNWQAIRMMLTIITLRTMIASIPRCKGTNDSR